MNISSFEQDNDLVNKGTRPNYIVVSNQTGCPFISAKMAIKWHNMVGEQGVQTTILDLTEYDWELNPLNFKIHNVSTAEGMIGVVIDLTTRSQSVIN